MTSSATSPLWQWIWKDLKSVANQMSSSTKYPMTALKTSATLRQAGFKLWDLSTVSKLGRKILQKLLKLWKKTWKSLQSFGTLMKSRVILEIKLLRILHKTVLIFFDLRLSTQGVILENQRESQTIWFYVRRGQVTFRYVKFSLIYRGFRKSSKGSKFKPEVWFLINERKGIINKLKEVR